jgi:parallel beta-helix repeat protein
MADMVELREAAPVLLLLLLVLPMVFVTRMGLFVTASPVTIDVFQGTHPTIQEAINNASSGDIIFVHEGTYYEDIVIDRSVSLVGEDRDLTIIYGFEAQYTIRVMAGGASIENFTVRKTPSNPYANAIIITSSSNVLEGNRIDSSYYGITLSSSDNDVIADNIVSNNTDGLTFYFSRGDAVSGNVVVNNSVGVNLYPYSNNNRFSGNTIYNSTNGLDLHTSVRDNVFYHNNFFNNSLQLWSESANSTNVWSIDGEGNYWSDYSGQDLNSDGIGDSPYNTDIKGGDAYPLMGLFHNLDVVLKSQTYDVNLISNSTISVFRFEIGEETGNKIVTFSAAGEAGTVGFCRIMIPLGLMESPFIVIGSEGEITPTLLNSSNETNAYLYFTYVHSNQTISIVSSETLHLYSELLGKYAQLLADLYNLNTSQSSLAENNSVLLDSLMELQSRYLALNASYYEHLSDYSRSVENIQSLTYVFAATTAIFLVTTVYLSKRSSTGAKQDMKSRRNEE